MTYELVVKTKGGYIIIPIKNAEDAKRLLENYEKIVKNNKK